MQTPPSPQQHQMPPEPSTVEPPERRRTGRQKKPRSVRARRLRKVFLIGFLCLSIITVGSYAKALTYPGNATFADRSVGWLRDNGANDIVNTIENWYYTNNAPSAAAPPPEAIPKALPTAVPNGATLPVLTTKTTSGKSLPNEGRWVPGPLDLRGKPALYTSFIQPDKTHPSVIAGVALIRQSASSAHLVAGTRQPDTNTWPGNAAIPANDVSHLLATFNSGFKAKDISGGFYLNGQYSRDLIDGQASAVITTDGRIRIGAWNQDVWMTPGVTAVRQNLHLIVANGHPEPGLTNNADGTWGSAKNQLQYTWRSGLGIDSNGNLIYVAGGGLTLETLAKTLAQAGAIQGMELDIHYGQVNFSSWRPQGTNSVPTKLLPNMPNSADRYLNPDQRDFFYLTIK